MEQAFVTFVVPTFKAEKHLADTLDSIRDQTDPAWRLVVVDDGSPDRSAEIAASFAERDPRISLIRQTNAGVSVARNRGAEAATTECVVFLDADDLISPTYLQTLRRAMETTHAVAVYGNVRFIDEAGSAIQTGVAEEWSRIRARSTGSTTELPISLLTNGPCVMTPGQLLVRTEMHRRIGGFDPRMSGVADWDYELRLAELGRVVFVDEVVFSYRRHEASMSVVHATSITREIQAVRLRTVLRSAKGRQRTQTLREHRRFYWATATERLSNHRWRQAAPPLVLSAAYSRPLWRPYRKAVMRWLGPPMDAVLSS